MASREFLDGRVVLHSGDCRDVMVTLPDASVDCIVCDPPYGLEFMGKEWDSFTDAPRVVAGTGGRQAPFAHHAVKLDKLRGHGFQAFTSEWAHEALRVLKPGGHLVAFGGTRTYHRLVCAIEDAGFEIRDQLAWLYGSGFPKSHNVSAAIDKARNEDLEPIRSVCRLIRVAMEAAGIKSRHLVHHFNECHPRLIDHWAARDTDSQPSLPTWEQWLTLKKVLDLGGGLDDEVWRLNGRKGQPGDSWEAREVTGTVEEWTDRTNYAMTSRDGLRRDIPMTDAAKQWAGWGTALKPSLEPICLARRPLIGTVAQNVLKHSVGGLNIDACRVGTEGATKRSAQAEYPKNADGTEDRSQHWARTGHEIVDLPLGRWPANLLLGIPADEYELRQNVTIEQKRELYGWLSENA